MSRADSTSGDPPGYSRIEYEEPVISDKFSTGYTVPSGRDPEVVKREYAAMAMNTAKGQFGQLFQVALMMYMFIGNQLNIWSIFFLLTMGTGPIVNLFKVNAVFAPYQTRDIDLLMPKLVYAGINLGGVGVFLWKLRAMGLLPVTASDWVSLLPTRTPSEHSSFGVPLQ